MDEAIEILRGLLSGEPVTFTGDVFDIADVTIDPPAADLPILIGGRSEAALKRTARHGDGWAGIWISPQRFAATVHRVAEEALRAGRSVPAWQHSLTIWCGFGAVQRDAARHLAEAMRSIYHLDPNVFARWCPAGPPEAVADFIRPYLDAGARSVSIIGRGQGIRETIESVADVRRLLQA
jgi:alkanesulfonate monooxygenase SsuD/methylene tetrahydromethanopterin reductase-like flavin-dependent oxidoreductase (luciferase family)